jgi:hypothetical protein
MFAAGGCRGHKALGLSLAECGETGVLRKIFTAW